MPLEVSKKLTLANRNIDLLRVVATELQQPLTHISGIASMLADGVFDESELEAQYRLLNSSSSRMQRHIESILFAGQLQNSQMQLQFEPINPASVLHDVVNELKPLASDYHSSLNLSISQEIHPVSANRQAVSYSIYNLLDVVIRSTQSEVVDVLAHHQLDKVMITIRDDSEKLPAGALKSILSRVGRTAQPVKQLPGTSGLGLYVASVLSDYMDGNLSLQTHHGKRVISLSLPLSNQTSLAL